MLVGTSGEAMMGRPITAFATVGEERGECVRGEAVSELLFCAVDQQVRPIVGNKKIENVAPSSYDAAALPFEHLHATDLEALAPQELDEFL